MRFPLSFNWAQSLHRLRMKVRGQTRYPTVLMLEPLYTCNLACIGCSVERHSGKLKDRIDPATCFKAVDECDAPIVNICGGEPTLYPELKELVDGLIERRKHVIICSNALKLQEAVYEVIPPHNHLFIMIHLDGMKETHDAICARDGVFEKTIEMIRKGRELGYHIFLNATVYKRTELEEVEELCQLSDNLDVGGILISPGYEFASIREENIFLNTREIEEKFTAIIELSKRYKINATPTFLQFAAGQLELSCAPWSTVNYTPKGWKAPCYLIEGEGYFDRWDEFWNKTDWEYWESHQDERCRNCKMHSGFEHSAVIESMKTWKGKIKLFNWALGRS